MRNPVMTSLEPKVAGAPTMESPAPGCPVLPGARLHPRPEFGRRFIIFVDTEEEFDWSADFSRASQSTRAIAALPAATARFNGMGVHPVYLCDYPVVTNADSAPIIGELARSGACDVGAHLHPWVTPPHREAVNIPNSFTGNLPEDLQFEKLATLTAALSDLLGAPPTVFRAGRYGLGSSTMAHLRALGYRMDVSVRSLFDYSNEEGPDYSSCPLWPWRSSEGIVQMPLSSGWTGHLRRFPGLYRSAGLRGPLARSAMLTRVPLTPEGTPVEHAIEAIRAMVSDGLDIFSLSFHSPTLAMGHTPYVQSQADLDRFWGWWDAVFEAFDTLGVTPVRYAELERELVAAP
ncbi:WalW protein [Chakrabartia godavariana]|nr:WalW protein [Chakrabartia godavariana]